MSELPTLYGNLYPSIPLILKKDRQRRNNHRSVCVWLTGLPGSGKSTTAIMLQKLLFDKQNFSSYILDGDNIRTGLCSDLGFSPADRTENIRRIGEIAKLFVDAGIIVICAFVSPICKDRDFVRGLFEEGEFFETYMDCPVETCEERDTTGKFKLAREGKIKEFTGVSAPYDIPQLPDIIVKSRSLHADSCAQQLANFLYHDKHIWVVE